MGWPEGCAVWHGTCWLHRKGRSLVRGERGSVLGGMCTRVRRPVSGSRTSSSLAVRGTSECLADPCLQRRGSLMGLAQLVDCFAVNERTVSPDLNRLRTCIVHEFALHVIHIAARFAARCRVIFQALKLVQFRCFADH